MTTVAAERHGVFGRERAEDIYLSLQLAKVYLGLL